MKYTKHFSTKVTPQSEPIPGTNQIANNAGGYAFETTPAQQFKRFLILGTEGGSYYVSENKLTKDNATKAISYIQSNGLDAVKTIVEVSDSGKAPKNDSAIFALALATTFGSAETKKAAYDVISKVCRTGTHLFQFTQSIQDLRGWSAGLRKGVSKFYTGRSLGSLDLQLVKYRQRDGWTHKDVIRLAHAHGTNSQNLRLAYAVGKTTDVEESSLITGFLKAQKATSAKEVAALITEYQLPWETVPTQFLKDKEVWAALLPHMGVTALLRNLAKLTSIGLISSNLSEEAKVIQAQLTNVESLKAGRVHPMSILLALDTYKRGSGFKGSLTWTPVGKIVDSLNDAFDASFVNVEPTGKNILISVDVSGSMNALVNNTTMRAAQVSAAMAYITARVEPNYEVCVFNSSAVPETISKRDSVQSVTERFARYGGSTDCAQPFIFANEKNLDLDAVVIYTDNETWAGNQHPVQALKNLRNRLNKPVKVVNAATTANNVDISDPNDPNALGITGFDASAPNLISSFIKGEF